jgi:hypothetical protein
VVYKSSINSSVTKGPVIKGPEMAYFGLREMRKT